MIFLTTRTVKCTSLSTATRYNKYIALECSGSSRKDQDQELQQKSALGWLMTRGNLHVHSAWMEHIGRKRRMETILVGHVIDTLHGKGKRLHVYSKSSSQPRK